MAITTLNKVNTILGLSGQDDLVSALIPLVEEEYLNIRNRPFDIAQVITGAELTVGDPDTVYPIGAEMTAIQMIGYRIAKRSSQGVASESLGDHSISYEAVSGGVEYPKSITGSIKRFVDFI